MEKFKILDGRKSLYQWDLNQKLIVLADEVGEIHFTGGTLDHALVCPVYQQDDTRLVDVPNILLQTDGILRVYAYVKDGDGGYTTLSRTFTVNPKPKPDDYVYTETEVWTAERAVAQALEDARANGDFDGPPGPKGDPGAVKYVVVNELPQEDTENAIYLVPVTDGAEDNLFDEYIFVDGKWEKIGSTPVAVDLTGYVKNTDVATYSKAGLVMPSSWNGIVIADQARGTISLVNCTQAHIDKKGDGGQTVAITTKMLDYAVKVGLTTNTETLTEAEKQAVCTWLGTGMIFANADGSLSVKLADGSTYKLAATKEE